MFEVRGNYRGRETVVRWDDGVLTVDDDVRGEIQALMGRDGPVGPVGGPYTEADHLESALSAMVLIKRALDVRPEPVFTGDVPEIPSVPDGAIP